VGSLDTFLALGCFFERLSDASAIGSRMLMRAAAAVLILMRSVCSDLAHNGSPAMDRSCSAVPLQF
jgi:hypothetical protein